MSRENYDKNFLKSLIILLGLLVSNLVLSQVGIGTTSPEATLDVRVPDPSNPTASAGIGIPQVSSLPLTGNRAGQIVILTTNNKFYYYDGVSWECVNCNETSWGDVKHSFYTTDHNGWFLLDGRLVSTLTTTQQERSTSLGFGNRLPNANDRVLKTKGTLNSTGGSNTVRIFQSNLPNVTFTGTTNTAGSHSHSYVDRGSTTYNLNGGGTNNPLADDTSGTYNTGTSGNHSHTVSVSSGGSGSSLNIENKYLSVKTFIYLGF